MKVYVISGGPSTGKTSVIEELKNQGFTTFKEIARKVTETDGNFVGKSINEINKQEFQDKILEVQMKQVEKLKKVKGKIFLDRSIGDTLAYYKLNNLKIPKSIYNCFSEFKSQKIFILEPLNFYEQDDLRQENEEGCKRIHETIIKTYKDLDCHILIVPFMSVKKRVEFILENL